MTLVNQALTRLFDAADGAARTAVAIGGPGGAVARDRGRRAAGVQVDRRPAGTRAAKRAMQAAIFEMRLFNDDLAALFRAQGEVLRHTLTYLRLSLAPTLWLIVPMLALMLHMEFHFGYTGLTAGEAALVKVRLAGCRPQAQPRHWRHQTPSASRHPAWYCRRSTRLPGGSGPARTGTRTSCAFAWAAREVSQDAARVRRGWPTVAGAARRRFLASQLLNPSEPPLPADAGHDVDRDRLSRRATSASPAGTSAGRACTWR